MRGGNVCFNGAIEMGENIRSVVMALVLGACVSGCAAESQAELQSATPSMDVVDEIQIQLPETHMEILEIIENGNKAKMDLNGNDLNKAAGRLRQIGAVPLDENTSDLAKEWSDTAKTLPTNVEDSAQYRGRVKGPAYRKEVLAGGEVLVLEEIYYASEKAELTLKTLSGDNLDVVVALQPSKDANTANDTPVCDAHTRTKIAACEWLPLWTAKYNITITNHGENPVPYVLVTN